jgi:hypothetical protein
MPRGCSAAGIPDRCNIRKDGAGHARPTVSEPRLDMDAGRHRVIRTLQDAAAYQRTIAFCTPSIVYAEQSVKTLA